MAWPNFYLAPERTAISKPGKGGCGRGTDRSADGRVTDSATSGGHDADYF